MDKKNLEQELLQNLIALSKEGSRVKHKALILLKEEIVDLLRQDLPISYIQRFLEKKYGFTISYRHFHRFISKLERSDHKNNEKISKTSSNFQRLPSQNQYNATVSEEESSACNSSVISPYKNEPNIVLDNKAAKRSCDTDRPIQPTTTSSQEVTSQTPPPDTKNESDDNKKYEIAPIGIEKKYSLEEIFPKEKWRFDVYNLPLKEGLEKELDDIYIIDAYECAMEIRRINYPKEYENEKTEFLKKLLWRVMKRGYRYNPFYMEYDKEAKNVYQALGYETNRLYKEDIKDQEIGRLTKPEFNTYDIQAIANKYKKRWLERMRSIASRNDKKEKQ